MSEQVHNTRSGFGNPVDADDVSPSGVRRGDDAIRLTQTNRPSQILPDFGSHPDRFRMNFKRQVVNGDDSFHRTRKEKRRHGYGGMKDFHIRSKKAAPAEKGLIARPESARPSRRIHPAEDAAIHRNRVGQVGGEINPVLILGAVFLQAFHELPGETPDAVYVAAQVDEIKSDTQVLPAY
jgi:hypothetical protein